MDSYAECEAECPCNEKCPNGCPCPFASTYCNKCETAECLAFTDIVLGKMNLKADPCEDFNTFACGGWETDPANGIPDDSGSLSQFSVVRKALSATLNRQLSDESKDGYHGWESVQKAKTFFSTCMDEDTIDATSNDALNAHIIVQWPTQSRDAMEGDKDSVMNSITTAHAHYGISTIFSADQDLDFEDSNLWIISLGHPSLAMSQSYYTTDVEADKEKYKKAYIGKL